MRFFRAFAALPFTLLACVQAQNSSEILEAAVKQLPNCALNCMIPGISKSSCGLSDLYCVARDEKLMGEITVCIKTNCTIREALTAKNFTESVFGGPVRDESKLVSYNGIVAGVFALLAVILRILARLPWFGGTWGLDDWAIIGVMLPVLPLTCLSVVLAHDGLGKDMWTVPFDNITHILHIYYFDELFYLSSIALTKISILLFYLRIFPARNFRRGVYITLGLCTAFIVAFIPVTIFQCHPIHMAWERWDGQHHGKCINLNAEGWASTALNIILDLVVICLPLRELSKLAMGRRKKAGIMLMFLGGGFVTVVSMLRLKWMIQFAQTENVTWDYTPIGYWSTLEVHIGVIIACLPALRSLQHRVFPESRTTASYSRGYDYPKGGSPFPSIAKYRRGPSDTGITNSQASMMRSRDRTKADKDFIQLEEYEIRLNPDAEKAEGGGRGVNNTYVERASVHTEDQATFLDTSSLHHTLPATVHNSRRATDVIKVRKEYSVNVEYAPNTLSSSPPEESMDDRTLSTKGSGRSFSVRRQHPHV